MTPTETFLAEASTEELGLDAEAWLNALRANGMPEYFVQLFKLKLFFLISYLRACANNVEEDTRQGPSAHTCLKAFWATVTLLQTGNEEPFDEIAATALAYSAQNGNDQVQA